MEWSLISCTEFCVDCDCIEPCFSAETAHHSIVYIVTIWKGQKAVSHGNGERERDCYALFAAAERYCCSKCTFSCNRLNIPSAELVETGDRDADEAMDSDR